MSPLKPLYMKKLLLPLLVPIAIGSIYVSAFAQLGVSKNNADTSDKWVMTKLRVKSTTGKLYVTLPKGAAWDMTIYAAGSSKVVSNTMLKTSFTLLPGTYDLEINKIKITGVPVVKGYQTRLKTGVLHIEHAISWTLYDEFKKTVLINSLAAETRGLPVGKYKLTIMGQDRDIEIKDGGTIPGDDTRIKPEDEFLEVPDVTHNWVVSPANTLLGMGVLITLFPEGSRQDITVAHEGYLLYHGNDSTNKASLDLAPGTYHVGLNGLYLDIPIVSGNATKLRTGLLKITFDDHWKIYKYLGNDLISSFGPAKVVLLPGRYVLFIVTGLVSSYDVRIIEGEVVTNGVKY